MYSAKGVLDLLQLQVGVGKLQTGLAKPRILLNGVPVLDCRLTVFLLGGVAVTAAQILPLGDLRVLSARDGRNSSGHDERRQKRAPSHDMQEPFLDSDGNGCPWVESNALSACRIASGKAM